METKNFLSIINEHEAKSILIVLIACGDSKVVTQSNRKIKEASTHLNANLR